MEQIKEKFIDYLSKRIDDAKFAIADEAKRRNVQSTGDISDEMMEQAKIIVQLGEFIDLFQRKHQQKSILNGDLDIISDYLQSSPLSAREKVTFLMGQIQYNINSGLINNPEDSIIIDPSLITQYEVTQDDLISLLDKDIYKYLLTTKDKKLTEEELKNKKILQEGIQASIKNEKTKDYIQGHVILDNRLFKKEDNYTEDDIEEIIIALQKLRINQELCSSIKYLLQKELKKREKRDGKSKSFHFVGKKEIKTLTLNDKEYKQLRKEISTYVDLYHMELKKELSEEETMYCAHLLLKIGEDPNLVRTFFMRAEQQQRKKDEMIDPIIQYMNFYPKLKYYEEKLEISQNLHNLDDYMIEMITSYEETEIWEEMFQSELSHTVRMLPKTYEYELSQASQYQQPNKVMRR